MKETPCALRVDRVTKRVGADFAPRVVVRDCSFFIQPGRFTVLIGPSGCGKTTLINMIAGYEPTSSGVIKLDGVPISRPGWDRLVVFQENALFPWMTTLDNVMYGPLVRGERSRAEVRKAAVELLKLVGLVQFADKFPMQLSGGMQRRAELARALINNPRVLLMDEPFRGLDHMTRELMQEYLLKLFDERGETILFVTSEIDEAIFLGDQIIVLSASPSNVQAVIDVDLQRPRERRSVVNSPRYVKVKKQVLDLLYGESSMSHIDHGAQVARESA